MSVGVRAFIKFRNVLLLFSAVFKKGYDMFFYQRANGDTFSSF